MNKKEKNFSNFDRNKKINSIPDYENFFTEGTSGKSSVKGFIFNIFRNIFCFISIILFSGF